jgi:hypothetical protein
MIWPHVIRIGKAEIFVESMVCGKELGMVAKVPLAIAGGGITFLFNNLSDGHLATADPVVRLVIERSVDADPNVIAAGHQPRPRGRANSLSDIEVGEEAGRGRQW